MKRVDLPITREEMDELYTRQKLTDEQIADRLGATTKQVRLNRHRMGIPTLPRWERSTVTPIEGKLKSLLVGSMLGDGGMQMSGYVPYFHEKHYEPQIPYMDMKIEMWGPWVNNVVEKEELDYKYKDGKTKMFKKMATCAHGLLDPWFDKFYNSRIPGSYDNRNGKVYDRVSPNDVDDFALAIWFMDDGTASHTASFASGANYSENGVPALMAVFHKFGLHPEFKLKSSQEGSGNFVLTTRDTDALIEIIRPHVPPYMEYKLQFGCRGKKSKMIRDRKSSYPELLRLLVEGTSYDDLSQRFSIPREKVTNHVSRAKAAHPDLWLSLNDNSPFK
jgi:DNA-binding CsgD family transcriptional regulator